MNPFLDRWMTHLESRADQESAEGRHREAAEIRDEICRCLERHLDEDDPLLIEQLRRLATCLRSDEQRVEAEGIYRRLLRLIQGRHGHQHLAFAQTLNQLGVLYCEMGRYRRATSIYRRALSLTRRQVACDDPRLGAIHHNLASAYHAFGHLRRARTHYEETLRILETCHPCAEHAQCLCDLAELLLHDDPASAETFLREGLTELRQVYAGQPPELAEALIRVAGSRFRGGRTASAKTLLREAEGLLAAYGPMARKELRRCRALMRQVVSDVGSS